MFINRMKIYKPDTNTYPFNLPIVESITHLEDGLEFNSSITFFAGENGSGKSTLLEAIAIQFGINPKGGSNNFNFSTFDSHSNLADSVTLVRKGQIPDFSFFLRAENYYNIASEIENLLVSDYYGSRGLHEMSHGEGMLSIITNRFIANGLYILDEPESGLSVSRQLTLLKEIMDLSREGCQFIIATHSPVLLAAPNATIYNISHDILQEIEYEETEAYLDMSLFINNPEQMIHYLTE